MDCESVTNELLLRPVDGVGAGTGSPHPAIGPDAAGSSPATSSASSSFQSLPTEFSCGQVITDDWGASSGDDTQHEL